MVVEPPIIPVYRALSISGNVLEKDQFGLVYHAIVSDTTLEVEIEVVFHLK